MSNRVVIGLIVLTAIFQFAVVRQYDSSNAASDSILIDISARAFLIDVSGMPFQGPVDATLVLIEFADFECPFCRRHASTVSPLIREMFVERNALRYVFANHPLAIHDNALRLAIVSLCAGEQHRYWDMHRRLFEDDATVQSDVIAIAADLGMDISDFASCLADDSGSVRGRIDRDKRIAADLGLTGTPGFALGRTVDSNLVLIEVLIRGAQPLSVFEDAIRERLEGLSRLTVRRTTEPS